MDKNTTAYMSNKFAPITAVLCNKISNKSYSEKTKLAKSPSSTIKHDIIAKRSQLYNKLRPISSYNKNQSQSFILNSNKQDRSSMNETNPNVIQTEENSEIIRKLIRPNAQISNFMNHRPHKKDTNEVDSKLNKSSIASSINIYRNSNTNSRLQNFNKSYIDERSKSVSVSYIDKSSLAGNKSNVTLMGDLTETDKDKLKILSTIVNELKTTNNIYVMKELGKIVSTINDDAYLKEKMLQVDKKCDKILKENKEIKNYFEAQAKELSNLVKEVRLLKLDMNGNKPLFNHSNLINDRVDLIKSKILSKPNLNSPIRKPDQPIKLHLKKKSHQVSPLDTLELISRYQIEDPKKLLYLPQKITMKEKNHNLNVPRLDLSAALVDKSESFNDYFEDNNINGDYVIENKFDSNITLEDKMNRAFIGEKDGVLFESNLSSNNMHNKINESSMFKVFDSMSINNLESVNAPDNNILGNIDSNGSTNPNSKKNKLNRQERECFLFGTFDRERRIIPDV